MKTTISDIAEYTGYSKATISLVLNDSARIPLSTKQKIRKVISELGYHPNLLARTFAQQRSMTIGVVLPQVKHHLFSDPYFSEAISGISRGINGSGYKILFLVSNDNFIKAEALELFKTKGIDGYVFIGATMEDRYIAELKSAGCPVIMINNSLSGKVPAVNIDNYTGAFEMVNYLAGLGYKKIAFMRGIETTLSGIERYKGFKDAMSENGLVIGAENIFRGDFSEEKAYNIIISKPEIDFEVLFAASDYMAIGAIRALKQRGLRIPSDVAVAGADNIRLGEYISPRLTTIEQPIFSASEECVKSFITSIQGEKNPVRAGAMSTKLVIRESCCAEQA